MADNEYNPIKEQLNNKLITHNDNFHTSLYKFYLCVSILLIFIMTFNIENKDKIRSELKEEMKEEVKNQIQENLITKLKSQEKMKNELIEEIKEEVNSQIEENLISKLKSQEKMKNELIEEMKEEIKNQIKENLLSSFQKYIRKDAFKSKVGLCVIGKQENKYAKEFVDYYKSIGFYHIFLYDNNEKDDERFEEVLNEDISNNFVSIINYRGYRGEENHPQFDAYIDCYEKNSKEYDWLAFYDFDEFLYLKNHKTIQEFVDQRKFDHCINIKINWIIYSDNDLIYYENKPVQERFTTPLPKYSANIHIKSLVRGNLPTNYWKGMINPHTSNNDYICCVPTGEKIDSKTPFNYQPNYDETYIKHYNTKTLEEYIKKAKRGSATRVFVKDEKFWRTKFEYFFSINKKTKEKLDYIKKVLNLDID